MRRPSRALTVRGYLVLLVLALLVPLLIVQAAIYTQRYRNRQEMLLDSTGAMARGAAALADAHLAEVRLAGQVAVAALTARPDEPPEALLATIASTQPGLRALGWFGPDGAPRGLSGPVPVPTGAELDALRAGQAWLLRAVDASDDGAPGLLLLQAIGPEARGGFVSALLDIDALRELWLGLHADRSLTLVLADPAGRPLWPAEGLGGDPLPIVPADGVLARGDRTLLAAEAPMAAAGWRVVALTPRASAMGPLVTSLLRQGAIFLTVALAATLLAAIVARRISLPVRELEGEARRMAETGRAGSLDRAGETGPREVRQLATSFAVMARELAGNRAALEERSARLEAEAAQRRALHEAVRREHAFLEAAVRSLPAGVVVVDPERRLEIQNDAAGALLGGAGPLLVDEDARHELLASDGRPVPPEALPLSRALRGERLEGEPYTVRRPDGSETAVLLHAAPVPGPDGTVLGAVLSATDVTPLRRLQRLRDDLLYTVSHDLRTPISAVNLHAQLLGRQLARYEDGAELQRRVSAIRVSLRRMDEMIEDLSDLARFEAGRLQLEPEPVALEPFVRDLLDRMGEVMQADRMVVRTRGLVPPVLADPGRLERILVNLLVNAAKHSPRGTPIEVDLWAEGEEVRLSVANEGLGLDPKQMPDLFRRFQQAEGRPRSGGLGLGLYISKTLVEALGGRIEVERPPGRMRFTVALPRAAEAGAAAHP